MPNVDSEIDRARERFEKLVVFENVPTVPPTRPVSPNRKMMPTGALAAVAGIALGAYFVGLQSPQLPPLPAMLSNIGVPTPIGPKAAARMERIIGLNAAQSEMTGVVDARTLTASYYWTFVVANKTDLVRQAQVRMRLPEGAVVSRATLWVNGIAQEAAFNENFRVQDAFNHVFAQRRDPILITKDGPDHVLIKASPVPVNGKMEFRVGITAPLSLGAQETTASFKLPSIEDANFGIAQQRLHLISPTQLLSSQTTDINVSLRSDGSLLTGQFDAEKLKDLEVFAERSDKFTRFATRATHSYPAAYIVADIVPAANGALHTVLRKSASKPDCPILSSEDAAFRLSNLWSSQEVARLLKAGSYQQAVQIAIAYRVVTDVTGAVVLENEFDYANAGLHRNQYQALAYMPQTRAVTLPGQAVGGGGGAGSDGFGGSVGDTGPQTFVVGSQSGIPMNKLNQLHAISEEQAPRPTASAAPSPEADAPMSIGATNGTVAPQGEAAVVAGVNTAGTVRVNKALDPTIIQRLGPTSEFMFNQFVNTSRDANLFDSGADVMLVPVLFGLFVSIYAGGGVLLLMSVLRAADNKPGARKLALLGAGWLAVAYFLPALSQVLLCATIICCLTQRFRGYFTTS